MKYFILTIFVSLQLNANTLQDQLKARTDASAKKMPNEIKTIMKTGLKDLKKSGIENRAAKEGRKVPSFALVDQRGIIVPIKKLYSKQPIVLTFYRGHWCPYCRLELKAYEVLHKEFEQAGAKVIALAPDEWKEIRKTKDKLNLSFDVYRDENNNIAKRMGIAFKLDKATLGVYKKFGIDLEESQGNSNNELPMPGTYVVDTNGIIQYAFADPDYKKRAEPSEVLKFVQDLK